MIRSTLQKIGFDEKEIRIYLKLLEMGMQPASFLARQLSIPKSSVFDALGKLENRGVVSRNIRKGVHYFSAPNPESLLHYLERQEHDLKSSKEAIKNALPDLLSMMNPYATRPRVETYEGWEGIKTVLDDTLNSKTEILSYIYADGWIVNKELYEYARENNRKRCKKGILERGLVFKTPLAEKYYQTYSGEKSLCDFRWISSPKHALQNEISIYEDKVSIASINPEDQLSVVIKSQKIADTQRVIFESAWNGAEKFGPVEIKQAAKDMPRSRLME